MRCTQYVKRPLMSYGPTISPARTESDRPERARSSSRSQSTLSPPYTSALVISSVVSSSSTCTGDDSFVPGSVVSA